MAARAMQLRVTVADTWTTQLVDVTPDEALASVKARVLKAGRIAAERAGGYEVKHAGVPVRDESRSLSALGIRDGAAMIVLSRRRRAVR